MRLPKPTLVLVLLAALVPLAAAQSPSLYEVPLSDRIEMSDVIVEGRVAHQESFWNEQRTLIFTSSEVEVYRVFKGDADISRVAIITPGGRVGYTAQSVSPALHLDTGDVGVFFARASRITTGAGKTALSFEPVAGVQGMARYDELRGGAADVFNVYEDIEGELHQAIVRATGPPAVVRPYKTPGSADQNATPKSGNVPVITSFSPGTLNAGTGDVLTINGTGFESFDGGTNSTVFFANADDGGSSQIGAPSALVSSWTDTQIQVRVPTRAGTGQVTVRTASSLTASSPLSLTVDYNLLNVPFSGDLWRSSLASKTSGGYSLRFSTNTADGGVNFAASEAVAPFERALLTWQQTTGLNMRADGADIDSSGIAPNSPNDIVTFETNTLPLPSGVLGRAFSGFTSCDGQTWIVEGVDLQFRRDGNSVTWNYGPAPNSGNRADFESVALHELGHAHQLGHIVAPGKVMHYALTNGTDVRTLDAVSDIAAGNDAIDFAQGLNVFCGRQWNGMTRLVNVGVEERPDGLRARLSDAYPNPAAESASFSVRVEVAGPVTVDLFDVLGRRVARVFEGVLAPGADHQFEIATQDLPAGLYLYTAAGAGSRSTRKLVVGR